MTRGSTICCVRSLCGWRTPGQFLSGVASGLAALRKFTDLRMEPGTQIPCELRPPGLGRGNSLTGRLSLHQLIAQILSDLGRAVGEKERDSTCLGTVHGPQTTAFVHCIAGSAGGSPPSDRSASSTPRLGSNADGWCQLRSGSHRRRSPRRQPTRSLCRSLRCARRRAGDIALPEPLIAGTRES